MTTVRVDTRHILEQHLNAALTRLDGATTSHAVSDIQPDKADGTEETCAAARTTRTEIEHIQEQHRTEESKRRDSARSSHAITEHVGTGAADLTCVSDAIPGPDQSKMTHVVPHDCAGHRAREPPVHSALERRNLNLDLRPVYRKL